jgi:chemotaxis protein methyltransferase CheR
VQCDSEQEAIEIRLLLEAINAKYGYDLRDYASTTMRRRVLAALSKSGLSHLGDLQHQIIANPAFFAEVLDGLTVRVSEIFRDPSFYRAFRQRVVPILRTYPLIRIWHAGCAAGEEVYTSAILLTEEGLYDRSYLYATDLSLQAVDQAKEGIYSADRLETLAENHRQSGGASEFASYFTTAYGRLAMKDSLRRNVSFFQHNLVSDYVFGEMHVIFCRNVLIYFAQNLREKVLDKLVQSLCPGGFLCLGASEQLPKQGRLRAFTAFCADERIYRHEG